MDNKIRISVVSTFRITDCNRDLIKLIDRECSIKRCSRVELIRELSGKQLENKQDVKNLQKWVKEQGFKTIERWLEHTLKERLENENSCNGL